MQDKNDVNFYESIYTRKESHNNWLRRCSEYLVRMGVDSFMHVLFDGDTDTGGLSIRCLFVQEEVWKTNSYSMENKFLFITKPFQRLERCIG